MYPNPVDVIILFIWFILPSVLISKGVQKFSKIELRISQSFLIGVTFWLFVFLTGSIIFGIVGALSLYFQLISVIGYILSAFGLICVILQAKKFFTSKKIVLNPSVLPIYITLLLLFCLCVILVLYHHIWSEFDVVTVYLPSARAMLETGALGYNPFDFSSSMMMTSPGLCIQYAFALLTSPSLDAVRIVPLFYFVFGTIAVYVLSYELFPNKKTSFVTLIVYMSFMSVLKTLAQFSLYTDFAFIFLLLFSIFLTTKWIKEKNNFWLLICGVTLTVMMFFKPSFGYIIVPTLVGMLLVFSKPWWCKYVGVLLAFLPVHLETFVFIIRPWLSLSFSSTYARDVFNLLSRWSPAAIVSILIILYIRRKKMSNHLSFKGIVLFLVPFVSFGIYLVHFFLDYGLLLIPHQLLNPTLAEAVTQFSQLVPRTAVDVVSYYSWYRMLDEGLAGAYLIPLILGVYTLIKYMKTNREQTMAIFPSLFVFSSLLVVWSYLGTGYNPRRLLLFAPFVAFIVVQGVIITTRFTKTSLNKSLVAFCLFDVLTLGYFWARYECIELISSRSFGLSSFELIDYYVLASLFVFVMALPRVIAVVTNKLTNLLQLNLQRKIFRASSILVVLALLSQLVLLNGIFTYFSSVQSFNGDFNSVQSIKDYYDSEGLDTKYLLGDFTDVISYFNDEVDSSIVLGFYIHYLTLFANRSVVDLTWSYGYEKFGYVLSLNKTDALEALYQNNIHYVLVPKSNYPISSVYSMYLEATSIFPFLADSKEKSPIASIFEKRTYDLVLAHSFMCYDLYSVKKLDYPFTVYPLTLDNQSYVHIPSSASLNIDGSVTGEAWIYMDQLPSQTGAHFEIMGKQWNVLRFFVSKEEDKLVVGQNYDQVTLTYKCPIVMQAKRWYHVAFTFNGSELNIYVNSIQELNVATSGKLGVNNHPLLIHGFSNSSINSSLGMIAGIRLYKTSLSAEEIVWNYGNTQFPVDHDLVLWFKFDEGTGNILHDSTNNQNNGNIMGAKWFDFSNP